MTIVARSSAQCASGPASSSLLVRSADPNCTSGGAEIVPSWKAAAIGHRCCLGRSRESPPPRARSTPGTVFSAQESPAQGDLYEFGHCRSKLEPCRARCLTCRARSACGELRVWVNPLQLGAQSRFCKCDCFDCWVNFQCEHCYWVQLRITIIRSQPPVNRRRCRQLLVHQQWRCTFSPIGL